MFCKNQRLPEYQFLIRGNQQSLVFRHHFFGNDDDAVAVGNQDVVGK